MSEDQVYDDSLMLTPVMDVRLAQARLAEFQEFIRGYLIEGEDYGTIPGTQKPTLYKPGGDKLCELYGLTDSYLILDKTVDFNSGLFDYEIQCSLTSRRSGLLVATGLGSCSSFEGKYRWRDGKRACPQCGAATIFASKNEPGFYCWAKKGGCGAKFGEDDQAILAQPLNIKIENDDFATLKNTILKMAKKRSKIDATLSATRSSGIFSQDIGDDDEGERRPKGTAKPAEPRATPQRKPKMHEGAETYLTELKSRQWVCEAKRGWLLHAVNGFFAAGGSPERLAEILNETAGVVSPDLLKEEQAQPAVKAIEAATKLGDGAPKKTAKQESKKTEPEEQRVHIQELIEGLAQKGYTGNIFDLVAKEGDGARKVKDIPEDKLGAVEARLEAELRKL